MYKVVTHCVWWGILLLVLTSAAAALLDFMRKNRVSQSYLILLSSLIGVAMYNVLFETRARYLYVYVPFYIICALLAIQRLASPSFVANDEECPSRDKDIPQSCMCIKDGD